MHLINLFVKIHIYIFSQKKNHIYIERNVYLDTYKRSVTRGNFRIIMYITKVTFQFVANNNSLVVIEIFLYMSQFYILNRLLKDIIRT